MKFTHFKSLVLVLMLFIIACKKQGNPAKTDNTPQPYVATANVYVAGTVHDTLRKTYQAVYWKNGTALMLTNGTKDSGANSIAVQGNDIYVSGYIKASNGKYVACYWKNGTKVDLADSSLNSSAGSIAFIGNDVYIAGSIDNRAVYWKNGTAFNLSTTNGASSAAANDITIAGADVYIAGSEDGYNGSSAIYWRNGVPVTLDGHNTYGNKITVQSNIVYVAGGYSIISFSKANTNYWKGGVPFSLSDSTKAVEATGIAVSGTDVYVACNVTPENNRALTMASYSKNDQIITLATTDSFVSSIALLNNDVYTAGVSVYNKNSVATFWKNSTAVYLPNPVGIASRAYAMVVTPL